MGKIWISSFNFQNPLSMEHQYAMTEKKTSLFTTKLEVLMHAYVKYEHILH